MQLKYPLTISHQQRVLLTFERTRKHLALTERFFNQISMLFHNVYVASDDNKMLSEMHIL